MVHNLPEGPAFFFRKTKKRATTTTTISKEAADATVGSKKFFFFFSLLQNLDLHKSGFPSSLQRKICDIEIVNQRA